MDWISRVWKQGIATLVAEDSRFNDVHFEIGTDGSAKVIGGPPEALESLGTPGMLSILRRFVRAAAADLNTAETRHALEDPSWPTLYWPPVVVAPAPPLEVQPPPEPLASMPPQAAETAPLPPESEPVTETRPKSLSEALDAAIEASGLQRPIAHEDDIVREIRGLQSAISPASEKMLRVCLRVWAMLDSKNRAYGNSALDPVRVFSKAPLSEQIRVRLDDKLSRLARGQAAGEDVIQDLMGYLVLLKVAELRWPAEK